MADQEAKPNKSITLSVRLLRDGRTVDDSLRDDHGLEERPCEVGRLFVGQAPALPPTWFDFVGGFAAGTLPRTGDRGRKDHNVSVLAEQSREHYTLLAESRFAAAPETQIDVAPAGMHPGHHLRMIPGIRTAMPVRK